MTGLVWPSTLAANPLNNPIFCCRLPTPSWALCLTQSWAMQPRCRSFNHPPSPFFYSGQFSRETFSESFSWHLLLCPTPTSLNARSVAPLSKASQSTYHAIFLTQLAFVSDSTPQQAS